MNTGLKTEGYYVYRNAVRHKWLPKLRGSAIRLLKYVKREGIFFHAIIHDDAIYIGFFQELKGSQIWNDIMTYFKSVFILNSLSILNTRNGVKNFSSNIHRDIRFFSGDCNLMLNLVVFLDPFKVDNGSTWILPKSHLTEEPPSEEYFFKNGIQITGEPGDILMFNSNLFHCSGENITGKKRRAIAITFTKSSMKQLLDYPRAIGYDKMKKYSYDTQQLLGFHSRVPADLLEWGANERTYKKNQD